MKELSKEELLHKLIQFHACYDLNCESPTSEETEDSMQVFRQIRKLIEEKPEPGGAKPGEYMHEWLKEDAVILDLPVEEIIEALARDNELLKDKLEKKPKVTKEFVVRWALEMAFRPNKKGYKEIVRDMLIEVGVEVEN